MTKRNRIGLCIAFAAASAVVPHRAWAEGAKATPDKPCPPADDVDGNVAVQKAWGTVPDQRVLTSFVGVSECWSADVENGSQKYLNNLYTTLVVNRVSSISEDGGKNGRETFARDYQAERRNIFERIFAGKTTSILISAKIHIRDPDVDFTVPFLSIDYNGKSGQGESFVTNLTRSDMAQPFFRLTPNSNISVTIDARSSVDMDINAGGAVIGTLKDALALAAPGSSLVTTVNNAQLNKIASTFDSGLSKLWSNSVSESSTSGKLISEWYPHAAIFVSVDLPRGVRTEYDRPSEQDGDASKRSDKDSRRTLWFKIQLSCPRLSIFDTTNICEFIDANYPRRQVLASSPYIMSDGKDPSKDIRVSDDPKNNTSFSMSGAPGHTSLIYQQYVHDLKGRIDPSQVLNYNLEAGKSVRQYITAQDWYATLTKTFKATTIDKKAPAAKVASTDLSRAGEFCEAVVEQLYNAGLSGLDSDIALWALAYGLPDFVSYRNEFQDRNCIDNMPAGWSPQDPAT